MSNSSNTPDQDHPHEDALAALHGMQSGDSNAGQAAETPSGPSSTGLVGMLAQGQLTPPPVDIGGSRSGFATPVPRGKPQPKLPGSAGQVAKKPGKFDTIGVAKEVTMPQRAESLDSIPIPPPLSYKSKPQRKIPKPPDWWRAAIPVMYTISSLLLFISLWAVGACISMLAGVKSYPLIEFSDDDNAFTQGSKLIAGVMLLCLPVSIAIGIIAVFLGSKIKKYEKKIAASAAAEAQATS